MPPQRSSRTARALLQSLKNHPPDVSPGAIGVLQGLKEAGFEAFLAGGCVRDLLLGRTPGDFDIATNAHPHDVMRLFPRVIPTGLQHGTVTVVWRTNDERGAEQEPAAPRQDSSPSGEHIEITTYRGEGVYLDGRRPEHVKFLDEIEQDLSRRDFTINAIAYDPLTDDVRDPFGGVPDLARRRLRAVGNPLERFSEDGLRSLRAVRFASMLRFGVDQATKIAIPATLETFRRVAKERVRDELDRLLVSSPEPSRGLRLLEETGLLAEIAPELLETRDLPQGPDHRWSVWEHTLRAVDETGPDLVLRLTALLHDVAKPRCAERIGPNEYAFFQHERIGARLADEILERLRFSKKIREQVIHLIREHAWTYRSDWPDGTVRRHLARLGRGSLDSFFAFREADARASGRRVAAKLANLQELKERFHAELSRKPPLSIDELAINGVDLMSTLELQPGPHLGALLRHLMQHVFDHPEDNRKDRLIQVARDHLSSTTAAGGQVCPPNTFIRESE